MENIYLPFITAFLLTAVSIPLSIKFAEKFHLIDDPKLRPHPGRTQNRVVPRAGGLPIFIGLFIAILLFIPMDKHIFGILISLVLLLVMGLLDDILTNFSPYLRLLFQFLVAIIVVLSGIGIAFITNPAGGILRLDTIDIPISFFGLHHIILIADLFALLWIVWMMNMVNWSKGVDGQMPGIVSVAAITIGIVSLGLFQKGDPNQLPITILSFIVAGTALAFLIFNWHPARIFPGFSGSTILGFMIAVLSILSGAKLAIALLVLLIPSVDFFYTFTRRLLSGKSPFFGDSKHLHHLLLKRGLSHPQISCLYILTCAILSLLATNLSSQGKFFAFLVIGVLVAASILWLHLFYREEEENNE